MSIPKCSLCGDDVCKATEKGSYLKRVNEKGVPAVLECRPSCDRVTGDQDDALLKAVGGFLDG